MKEKISITVESGVLRAVESLVDGIRIKNRSDAIEHLLMRSAGENRIAVILCGGDEKNQILSNEMFRFVAKAGERTVIEDCVLQLKTYGFSKIFVVGRNNALVAIFSVLKNGEHLGVKMEYVEEKVSRGTMDSLRLVSSKINGDFLVVYGDLVFRYDLHRLYKEHIANNGVVTLALSSAAHPSEKGTVQLDGNRILSFSQKVKASSSFIAFTPIFVARSDIFMQEGCSLEDDVFVKLASSAQLYGLVLSGREVHIHKMSDLKDARKIMG